MQRSRFLLAAALAATALIVAPAASKADFNVQLTVGSDSVTLDVANGTNAVSVTGGSGAFAGLTTAQLMANLNSNITFTGATNTNGTALIVYGLKVDGYSIAFTGASSNYTGTASQATLNITAFTVKNDGGSLNALTLGVSEGGFLLPTGHAYLQSEDVATFSGANSGVNIVSSTSYNNGAQATPNQTINSGFTDATNQSGVFTSATNFTLTDTVKINNLLGGYQIGDIGLNGGLYATPAPSGLILAATMVPFFGLLRRRMRQRVVSSA